MRFLGLIIALAIVGYTIYLYLGSAPVNETRPEQYIDQARQSTDALNQALQNQKDRLEKSD